MNAPVGVGEGKNDGTYWWGCFQKSLFIQALHFIENEDEQADNEQENIEPTSAVCEAVKKKRIWPKETKSLEWWWELSSVWSRSKSLHNSPVTIPFIADVMDTVTKN